MKRSKSKNNNFTGKIIIAGVILLIALSLAVLVKALIDDEKTALQNELSQLENELTNSGYDWLIDYSGDDLNQTISVEVYRENGDELITTIDNILSEGWYKTYLTTLEDDEGYGVFDLRVKDGGVEKISEEILQKKMRIDGLRRKNG